MGARKAELVIDGEPMAQRLERRFREAGASRVTFLGPEGYADESPGAGPLSALASFTPEMTWIFVCSCDVPLLDVPAIRLLLGSACQEEAVIPQIEGRLQPLCALYPPSAFAAAREAAATSPRVMNWIAKLSIQALDERTIQESGVNPLAYLSANTPEEWATLTRQEPGAAPQAFES
jgi:molybdopterin-guanine dinucleotide biosynthesis protein A